jgi:hypothetical protein
MPEIADVMDVNIEDLSPEQRQQLQDVVDQFQQKCMLSFKKNRSGVPYLKNEMPRVLLPGESDSTTQQEKEECIHAFRDAADHILSRHHKAFLGAFKQMMVAVFGPGMEQAFSKAPIQGGHRGVWRVQFSAAIAEPASPASSSERWESSFPASSTRCGGSAISGPAASRRRTTSSATTIG